MLFVLQMHLKRPILETIYARTATFIHATTTTTGTTYHILYADINTNTQNPSYMHTYILIIFKF